MIAAATGGDGDLQLTVRSARPLTSLWAGYGTITEVETDDNEALIVKVGCGVQCLSLMYGWNPCHPRRPPPTDSLNTCSLCCLSSQEVHPPASSGVSHERKLRSYQARRG